MLHCRLGPVLLRGILAIVLIYGIAGSATVAQTSTNRCVTEVIPLIYQVGLDVQKSAPALGCWQGDAGGWYMPTVEVTADPDTYAGLQPQGQRILQAIDRMAMDPAFSSSVRFERTSSLALLPGAGGTVEEIDVSDVFLGLSSQYWMNNYRDAYEQSLMTYLTRTAGDENELVLYLEWFMSRRDVTLSTLFSGMNPLAEMAALDAWGYQRAPWPWQLADPYAIAEYTGQDGFTIGAVPTPTPIPTPEPNPTPLTEPLEATADVNGPAVFTPNRLTVTSGDTADITVALPLTTFGGGFTLTISLPAGTELSSMPQCAPTDSCPTAALQTEIRQNQGGSTTVSISGLMGDSPLSFAMAIKVTAGNDLESPLIATAELGFMSRSAPTSFPLLSEMEIVIEAAKAESDPLAFLNGY